MPGRNLIVIGASAGGLEALLEIVRALPAELPAAVLVVLHISPHSPGALPAILARSSKLPVSTPTTGEKIQPGHIYVAIPDHHLLVHGDQIHLTRGPAENGHRPSVDTLFRSAARYQGARVVGVVLSGMLDDGTAGLQAIKIRHGLAVVQDPDEALFPGMPRNAVDNVAVDHVLPVHEIAPLLARLASEPLTAAEDALMPEAPQNMDEETEVAEFEMEAIEAKRPGRPTGFTCPDCHGALWEVSEDELVRFRCRVGHAFSPDSLLAAQSGSLEDALWIALRTLEESAALTRRLSQRATHRGHRLAAARFDEQTAEATARAGAIRRVLSGGQIVAHPGPPAGEEEAAMSTVEGTQIDG